MSTYPFSSFSVIVIVNLLNHFASRADHRTDKFLRDHDLLDPRNERFEFGARFGYRFKYLAKNVHTALFGLFESLSQHLV